MREQDYIYEVYRERSFSRAAKNLFISQPALSMAVRKTEEELGITIFNRSTTPLGLTEAGKVYIRTLEVIRAAENTLKQQLADMAELKSGRVVVAGENFVSSFIMPDILTAFSGRYGGITVELTESNSPDLRELLLTEAIDLLIAHEFTDAQYEAVELFRETVLLAVPAGLPVNNDPRVARCALEAEDVCSGAYRAVPAVDLSLFSGEEFLLLRPGNDMCHRAQLLCTEAGFVPTARMRLDQLITSCNLASAGMGAAFVTDVLVRKAQCRGCVLYRIDSPHAVRSMCIGYKRNRYLSRAAQAFIGTALEVYRAQE